MTDAATNDVRMRGVRLGAPLAALALLTVLAVTRNHVPAPPRAPERPSCETPSVLLTHPAPPLKGVRPDPGRLQRKVRPAFGERYAGMWIDRDVTPAVVRVAVVGATEADEATLRRIAGRRALVGIACARFGLAELKRFNTVVLRIVSRLLPAGPWGVGVDEEENVVSVQVNGIPPTLFVEIEAAGIPPGAVLVYPGFTSESTSHSR